MIVIRFQGGLGNQLFQYALYKEFEFLGKKVAADLQWFRENPEKRKYELQDVFGINVCEADRKIEFMNSRDIKGEAYRIFQKYVRGFRRLEEKKIHGVEHVLKLNNGYLDGYWQNTVYFKDVINTLAKELCFCGLYNAKEIEMLNWILDCNSVSVHIRLGDYLADENYNFYSNICTYEYYRGAIDFLKGIISKPIFFVFSDDIAGARKYLGDEDNFIYVDVSKEAFRDMRLMSCCKHNIIANSTFSWWAAFLNKNDKKIIVAPEKWNSSMDINPCDGMDFIKISNQGIVKL